jgi:hypothetical protein
MTKFSVITDQHGKVMGAVRTEPFKTSDGKQVQFRPNAKYGHHEIDVDDRLLKQPASEVGKAIHAHMKSK